MQGYEFRARAALPAEVIEIPPAVFFFVVRIGNSRGIADCGLKLLES